MLARLRNNMAVGRSCVSPSDITGKLERKSAGFVHAALHELRELAEVAVAGSQLTPGIADADDRAAIEHVVGITLVLDPAAMQETIFAFPAEPGLAASRALFWNVHRASAYKAQTYASNSFLTQSHTCFGMSSCQARSGNGFSCPARSHNY